MRKSELVAKALELFPVKMVKVHKETEPFDMNSTARKAYIDGFEAGMGHLDFKPEEGTGGKCPQCGKNSVYGKSSGGEACSSEGCNYWFCF